MQKGATMHRNSTTVVRPPHFVLTAWIMLFLGVAVVGLGNGCRKSLPNGLIPVSGHVRLDGKPLAGASVTFQSDQVQIPGCTDENGRYELQPGAAAGEYRVTISKLEGSPQSMLVLEPAAAGNVPRGPETATPPKQAVPPRYSDPMKTELRFSVLAPGTTRADFDLATTTNNANNK
jgi:hypothetical protein